MREGGREGERERERERERESERSERRGSRGGNSDRKRVRCTVSRWQRLVTFFSSSMTVS